MTAHKPAGAENGEEPAQKENALRIVPTDITPDSEKILMIAQENADSKPTESLSQKLGSRPRLVLLVASILALIASLLATIYFTKTNLASMSIATVPAGRNISSQLLQNNLQTAAEQYKISLQYPDGKTKSFPLKDTGVKVDIPASIDNAKKARKNAPFLTRLAFWRTQVVPLSSKTDEPVLSAFINKHATIVNKPARDAALVIDKGTAKITPEANGQGASINDGKTTLLRGIESLQTASFQVENGELKPVLVAKDLEMPKKKAEKILAQKITLAIGSETIQARSEDIGNWIEITPVISVKTVDITVNGGKVLEYLEAVAKTHINPARAKIISTQPDGLSVVLVEGQNGSDILKKEAVAADITKKISLPSGAEANLPISYTPYKTVTAQAYDKWLAVDVTSKRMYAYEKTNLMRTVLISAGAPGTPTVLGQYNIYTKLATQDMRGQNTDGSRYFQAGVRWVNYFHKDYAIHGNHWRPTSYFGNINSSHGCVGIVNTDAEWVYNWAPVGTPVIVFD